LLSQTTIKKTLPCKKVAIYREDERIMNLKQAQIVMTTDDLYDNKYKILFGVILDENFDDYYGS